jgi:nitric oxide reductase NorQ protein
MAGCGWATHRNTKLYTNRQGPTNFVARPLAADLAVDPNNERNQGDMTVNQQLEQSIDKYFISGEPYYLAVGKEVELFETAYKAKLPAMLKGPTGCGKTRFVEYMAWKLRRPLVTVACHEDLSATDLVGRFLLEGDETVWHDGPLAMAVKHGAICYLDEVVEARKDTIVLIHPLTDDRRILPVEKRGSILKAPNDFMLVVSYNPGYQSVIKDLKQSTRQRFVGLEFTYPPARLEAEILMHEGNIDGQTARDLVVIGEKVRNLKGHGLEEGVSTRLLVYAAQLISRGIHPHTACEVAINSPITDDAELQRSIREIVTTVI